MNISLPAGTFVILPVSALETFKRYAECLNGYACEITGKDATACVSSVAHYDYEIEKISNECYRIHKKTEHLARHIEAVVRRWKEADSSRVVFTKSICLEHDAQKAIDSANKNLGGQQGYNFGTFKGGYAVTTNGFTSEVTFDEDGNCTGFGGEASEGDDYAQQVEELKIIVGDLSKKLIEAQAKASEKKPEAKKETTKAEPKKSTRKTRSSTAKSKS